MTQDQELQFQEKFDPALISALYKNFRNPIEALLEIVDNAVDDIIPGKPMVVTAEIGRDSISIVDKGGTGMGPEELDAFFTWGLSKKRGKLGRYGQGGKAAMGYLGKSWVIRSTKINDALQYVVRETTWDDRTGGLKKYKPEIGKTIFVNDGVVQIDISNLKRKINKNDLKRILSMVYRPLLESGELELISSGKIMPLTFPLEMPKEDFVFPVSKGRRVKGWLGFLEDDTKLRGGVRCYSYGRLIVEKEFFGQKDPGYKQSINKLIGEIYIDFDIPLMMNKTDFDRGSTEWNEIAKEMYGRLEPLISILLEEKEKDQPTEKEIKAAKYAGEKWKEFLKFIEHQQNEGVLPGTPIEQGQKQPEARLDEKENVQVTRARHIEEPYQPATPPPPGAIGKRKRTGSFPEPKIRALTEEIRYQISDADGVKIILINNRFPLYKDRKNQLSLYIWETLILEYARAEEEDTQTVGEYIEEMNILLHDLSKFIMQKNIKITI